MKGKVYDIKVERFVRRGIMITPELELAIATHNSTTARVYSEMIGPKK